MISKAALYCLKIMVQAEERGKRDEAELVCEGDVARLGLRRVSPPAIKELLQHLAIVKSYEGGQVQRYAINGVGRAINDNPKLSEDVAAAIKQGEGFMFEGGKVTRVRKR
ncbi:hypothetical protein [Mesorhizobium sp. SP-1A]|uniref:hypothetical protein n=1 Tax=Mesorhizobium sp. SP-1A TaxID=3077840 RepID=UPI0028F6EC00|nr:hypothetical protein [Mesorhizobium sp. SP-1A]